MELYIAGGCGEHGRNCFWFAEGEEAYLVDCGRMAGAEPPEDLPKLTTEQIQRLRGVFLTHSHADHTGALPWLFEQGYKGPVIATSPTLEQLPFPCGNSMSLDELCKQEKGVFRGIQITWGRSGHCAGSVWLQFAWHGKTLLFSGDYSEQSEVYPCDKLRGSYADLAVVDCAYGSWEPEREDGRSEIVRTIRETLAETLLLFLPVPKYGRGLELLHLLHKECPELRYYGDEHFCKQVKSAESGTPWYQCVSSELEACIQPDGQETEGIVFLSDPQLRGDTGKRAQELLSLGAVGIMTGTADRGSLSEKLMQSGAMHFCRYPVHLNEGMCSELIQKNFFQRVIRYHSPEYHYVRRWEI